MFAKEVIIKRGWKRHSCSPKWNTEHQSGSISKAQHFCFPVPDASLSSSRRWSLANLYSVILRAISSALVGVPPAEPPTDKWETPASPALKQIHRPVSSPTRSAWHQVERRGQPPTCSDPEKQPHGNTLPEASNCSPTMGSFQRQQCFPISVSKAADIFYAHECQACYTKWIFTNCGWPRNLPTLHQPPCPPTPPHSALAGLY